MLTIYLFTIAVIAMILEVITMGFFFIWVSIGFIVAGILSLFTDNFAILIIISSIVAIASAFALRSKIMNKIKPKKDHKTSFESYLNKEAIVTKKIENTTESFGEIKINGVVWNARNIDSDNINKGEIVKIISLEGSHMIVKKLIKK